MSTLKEAVESGRRWRVPAVTRDWFGPGPDLMFWCNAPTALSSDFEIEPEPNYLNPPKEFYIHDWTAEGPLSAGRLIVHSPGIICGDCILVHSVAQCDQLRLKR